MSDTSKIPIFSSEIKDYIILCLARGMAATPIARNITVLFRDFGNEVDIDTRISTFAVRIRQFKRKSKTKELIASVRASLSPHNADHIPLARTDYRFYLIGLLINRILADDSTLLKHASIFLKCLDLLHKMRMSLERECPSFAKVDISIDALEKLFVGEQIESEDILSNPIPPNRTD